MVEAFEEGLETPNGRLGAAAAWLRTRSIRQRTNHRHPLQTSGITFGIGLVCGLAVGWLAERNRK